MKAATVVLSLVISLAAMSVSGDLIDQLSGTQEVKHKSLDFSGVTKGCELSYLYAERRFSKGKPVLHVMSGSVFYMKTEVDGIGLGIKLGVKDVFNGVDFQKPYYVYLKSESGSTVGAKFSSLDGEPGFRVIVVDAASSKEVMSVLSDILKGGKVKIGYNWSQSGMDDVIELDLMVSGVSRSESGGAIKLRSTTEIEKFGICMSNILS